MTSAEYVAWSAVRAAVAAARDHAAGRRLSVQRSVYQSLYAKIFNGSCVSLSRTSRIRFQKYFACEVPGNFPWQEVSYLPSPWEHTSHAYY